MRASLRKPRFFAAALIMVCVFIGGTVLAQTKTWNGSVNTDFNTAGNWTPSGVPGSSDDVSITVNGGTTVTVSAGISIKSLTFAHSGTTNSTATFSVNSNTVNVTNNVSVTGSNGQRVAQISISTGTLSVGGNLLPSAGNSSLLFSGTGLLKISGSFGTFSAFTPGSGTIEYNANGPQTVNATPSNATPSYNNLTLSGSGSKTTTSVTVNGILSLEGTATASVAPTYGSSATLQYNTSTARTAGTEWITPFIATGGVIIDNTGEITLNGAKVFGNNTSVPLNIKSGAKLNTSASNFGLTFHGDFINAGTLTAGSSAVTITGTVATQSIAGFTTTGGVSLTKTTGTATFTGSVTSGSLTINGSGGTLNLGASLTHAVTNVTLTAGTLNGGSSIVKVSGIWSGTTGFTASTGTVNYIGSGQTVGAVSYNNLDLTTASGILFPSSTVGIAGTFTPASITTATTGTIDFNGTGAQTVPAFNYNNLTISGSRTTNNVTLASGTINVAGNYSASATFSSGTYVVAGSTVILNGGASSNQTISGTPSFNNLTINQGSGATANFGTSITSIAGNLTVSAGTMDGGTSSTIIFTGTGNLAGSSNKNFYDLKISSGSTMTNTNGDITIGHNFTNDGTLLYSGSRTTTFNGGGTQTISGNGSTTFFDLKTNNSTTLSLSSNITVDDQLIIATGMVNVGSKILTFGTSAQAVSAGVGTFSATRMIIADGGGEVRKTFTNTGSYTFPIGDNTGTAEFSPITVNVTAGAFSAAYVGVSVTNSKHPNNSSSTNYLKRYWTITQSGITSATATITGTYVNADINGTETSIKAAQLKGTFNQSSNPWIKFVSLGSNTLTATGASLTSGQASIFSGITGADPTVSISGGGVTICNGNTASLTTSVTGDPSFIYSWSPTTGLSSSTVSNPTASPTTTTTYTVTAKDGNGIAATANTTITVRPTPTATISGITTVCQNATSPNVTFNNPQSIAITVTYNINSGSNQNINVPANSSASVAASTSTAGTFTYSILSAAYQDGTPGCSNTISGQSATITVTATVGAPVFTAGATSSRCQAAGTVTYTATASNSTSISYSLDGSSTSAGVSINISTGAVTYPATFSGSAVITATAQGCNGPSTATHSVTVNLLPQGSLTSNSPICSGSTGQLTFTATSGTGPFTVVYNDGVANQTANNVSSGTPFNVSSNPTSNTTYTIVSVSDANGCSRSTGFTGGSTTILVGNYWKGVNTNWSDASNWTCAVPTSTTDGIIPSGLSNYPSLASGTGSVRNLTIQSGASLTVTSILQIAGTVSNSGGFTASGGTIEFNGSPAQSIPSSTFSSNTVQNLIVNNAAGVTTASNLIVGNALTLTNGIFSLGSTSLTIGGNITKTSGSVDASSATVVFNGTSAQSIAANSFSGSINNFTVDNTGGSVSINDDITIAGTLTFSNGKIITGTNKVIIGTSGVIIGGGTGWVVGNLQKNFLASAASSSIAFEVGGTDAYRPVTLALSGARTAGSLTATVTSGQHPNVGGSGIVSTKDVNQYYTIISSGGFSTSASLDITFNYLNSDIIGGANPSTFVIRRYTNSSWLFTSNATNTGLSSKITLSSYPQNNTSDFAIGECVTPDASNFAVSAANACNSGTNGAPITITSTSLANGTYDVSYTLSSPNATSTTKPVNFSGGTGTFNTGPLANNGTTTITITSITVSGTPSCSPTFSSPGNTASFSVSATNTWTGNSGTNWNTTGNWSCGFVPTSGYDVVIPNTANKPVLSTGTGSVHDLTVDANAGVTITAKLQIAGGITNNGTINALSGAVEFNGNSAQTIPASIFTNNNTVGALIISNDVSLGGPLNVSGSLSFGNVNNKTLTTNNNLTLKSTADSTARVADLTNGGTNTKDSITGNVTVERYIPDLGSRRYRLLTAPVTGTTINAAWQEGQTWNGVSSLPSNGGYGTLISGETPPNAAAANANGFDFWSSSVRASVRTYVQGTTNSAASFTSIGSTKTAGFNNNEAYLLYVRGTRSLAYSAGASSSATTLRATGVLKQGPDTVQVAFDKSHTLIGNPYASPLDFQSVYNANSSNKIQNLFWVWQASYGTGTGAYLLVRPDSLSPAGYYEYLPAPFDGHNTSAPANRYIHSGQGFFVQPDSNAVPGNQIIISETHKVGSAPGISVFRTRGADRIASAPSKLYVNFNAINNDQKTLLDGVLAEYDASYTLGADNIAKAINSGENLSIPYNNTDLIVFTSPLPKAGDILQLRMWNVVARAYQLEVRTRNFAALGLSAVLEDKFLNTQTPLQLNESVTPYNFTVTADAASKDPLRFRIVFSANLSPLPLHITSVRAQEKTGGVSVEWTVENETGVKAYDVEKSTDGTAFKHLSTTAASGSNSTVQYEILDAQPAKVNYYRIKLLGIGGEVKYSGAVRVEIGRSGEKVSVYPNPVEGSSLGLQLQNKPKGVYTLTLYNAAGQRVMQQNLQHGGGSATETLQLPNVVGAGYYTLEVKDSNGKKDSVAITVVR